MNSLIGKHWHHLPADEVIGLLDGDKEKGLDLFEVETRQKHFGPNAITGKTGRGPLLRLLLQFHQPLIYILLAAGTVTASLQEWVDSGVIFGVVLVNAFIGFVQEAKAVKAIEALARTMNIMFYRSPISIEVRGRILAVSVFSSFVVGIEKWLRAWSVKRRSVQIP